MAYLVAKYCLVFLITGLFGFIVGRWSVRRLFVDVTDSYQTLSETSKAATDAPWEEFRQRFDDINGNVRNIVRNEFRAHPFPEVPRALFSKLENALAEIKHSITQLPAPERVDLSPVEHEIQQLNHTLDNLSQNVTDKVATHDDIDSLGRILEKQLAQLAGDVAAIPEPRDPAIIDLTPLEQQIADLHIALESLPPPEAVNLKPLETRLTNFQQQLSKLPGELAEELTAGPASLTAVTTELATLQQQIALLVSKTHVPDANIIEIANKLAALDELIATTVGESKNAVDFKPLYERIDHLENLLNSGNATSVETAENGLVLQGQLAEIHASINALGEPKDAPPPGNILNALGDIEGHIKEMLSQHAQMSEATANIDKRLKRHENSFEILLERPPTTAVDLSPLDRKVESIRKNLKLADVKRDEFEQSIFPQQMAVLQNNLESQHAQRLEQLAPLDERLTQIHNKLSALNALAPESISENGSRPSIGPKLLKRPEFGKKDNLQQIAGIGPKLEQSLNKLGVYYYWQIAAWNKRDIRAVDANLEAFRGRIERDDWVSQAKMLRKLSHASRPPSGREMAQKLN